MASSPTKSITTRHSSGAWVWFGLPLLVRRIFPSFALTLTDGIYLAALGRLASFLPFFAFCIGFVLSGFILEPGQIFSASLWVVGILIAVSSFGAALGVWLLCGYIAGDLLILRALRVAEAVNKFGQQGWRDVACVVVLYAILSMLLVSVPALSARLRQVALLLPQEIWLTYTQARPNNKSASKNAPPFLEKASAFADQHQRTLMFPLDAGLQVAFSGLLVYAWTQIAVVMMRSAFIWYRYPDLSFSEVDERFAKPLQENYASLIYTVGCVALLRVGLEYFATSKPDFLARIDDLTDAFLKRPERAAGLRSWLGELVRAGVLLVLLFGILMTPFYTVTTGVVLLISLLLRKAILPRITLFARVMWSVPLIARIGAAGVMSYALSLWMMGDYLNGDFYTVLRPLWLSLFFSSLLFPDEAQHFRAERGQTP